MFGGSKPKAPPPIKRKPVDRPESGKLQVSSVFGGNKQQTPAANKPTEQAKVEAPAATKDDTKPVNKMAALFEAKFKEKVEKEVIDKKQFLSNNADSNQAAKKDNPYSLANKNEVKKPLNPFELKMQEEKARKEAERMKKKEDDKKNDPFIQKTSFESKLSAPPKKESIQFFKPKEEMKDIVDEKEIKVQEEAKKPEVAPVKEEKKLNPEIKKESKPAESKEGEDDFKKSLAAMIGRGKPGAKRSTVAVKPTPEIKKKTVDNIFDEDHEDDKDNANKVNVSDAMEVAMLKPKLP